LASAIVLNNRNNHGECIVEMNGKTWKARITETYIGDCKYKFILRIEGFPQSHLDDLGVELDASDITVKHTALIVGRTAERKAAKLISDKKKYAEWQGVAASNNFEMGIDFATFADRTFFYNILKRKETHQGKEIEVEVAFRDGWFTLSTGYNREQKKRTKKIEKLDVAAAWLINHEKQKIDSAIEKQDLQTEGIAKARLNFGEDIEAKSHGRRIGGQWRESAAYAVKGEEKYSEEKIVFADSYEGGYSIKSISGTFSKEEMEVILDVVRNHKED